MPSDVRSSAPNLYGALRLVAGVVNYTDSTVTLDTLAVGDVVIKAWVQVTTAFNAGTTNTLILGNGVSTNKFLATGDSTLGSTGAYPAAYKAPVTAETVAGTLTATYAQTGTAASAGVAKVYALVTSLPL